MKLETLKQGEYLNGKITKLGAIIASLSQDTKVIIWPINKTQTQISSDENDYLIPVMKEAIEKRQKELQRELDEL